ncbi:MAG: CRISPR-associated protein Cmr3 [Porticoccaceae bacterium]|nr:MAG: CRISPR-associated protein Cmr3 [Porticoccaceae bacterium]
MNARYDRFVEPLDVLVLRANQNFGDPGSYGQCQMPPWPSVMAGSLRSRMLVDAGIDPNAFARGEAGALPELGTPDAPGSFTLCAFHLAVQEGEGAVEPVFPMPADLVVQEDNAQEKASTGDGDRATEDRAAKCKKSKPLLYRLQPHPIDLPHSAPLPQVPVFAEGKRRSKPLSGYWLRRRGWQRWLAGEFPAAHDLIETNVLWHTDSRVGIGMQPTTRSVETGKLFTTEVVALRRGVGFAVAVSGAVPPSEGLLRLGGDGHAAAIREAVIDWPQPDYDALCRAGRCRLILTSPGIFTQGWRPTDEQGRFAYGEVRAKLVAAAVPRAQVISGWDLARRRPKVARRTVPAGAVYWLDDLQATPEALRRLVERGLWQEPCEDEHRRAEGFNRFTFATW